MLPNDGIGSHALSFLRMLSKKRKNDFESASSEDRPSALESGNSQHSQPQLNVNLSDGDESDWKRQLASMRARLDEAHARLTASQAELAASQADVERLRAAALVPCPRCNFHADWTVRVRTMVGQVHTIACPDGPATLVAHVKKELAQYDPKFHIQEQLTLVLPCGTSSSCSTGSVGDGDEPNDLALADDRALASCGILRGGLLDLFLVDMVWDDASLAIIDCIQHGGDRIDFPFEMPFRDTDLALSWALVNEVCLFDQTAIWNVLEFRTVFIQPNVCFLFSLTIQTNPALSSLNFYQSRISAGGVSMLCAALCALSSSKCSPVGPHIRKLRFSENNTIGASGAKSCSELMRVSKWLQVLGLSGCEISTHGAVSVASALHANTSLRALDLSGNNIGLDGFVAIGAALCVNSGLEELDLSCNQIGVDGVDALAEALKVNCSLLELELEIVGLNSSGAAHIAAALQLNSTLRRLSLSENSIDADGAELLSVALRVNMGLEHFDLSHNQIGDRGASSLGDALSENATLVFLDLCGTQISNPGSIALARALFVNSTLTRIDLHNNIIGDNGAVALGEALCVNSAMRTIGLRINRIGRSGAESIRRAMLENSRLEPILLDQNPIER